MKKMWTSGGWLWFCHSLWKHSSCLGLCYSTAHWEMLPQSWFHLQCPKNTRTRARSWKKCLGQHSVDLNVQVPFSEYATANDQVEMTERLSEPENYPESTRLHPSWRRRRKEDGEDPDSDDDVSITGSSAGLTTAADESEIIYTSNQFLHTISQQKTCILRNKLPSGAIDALNNLEQFILDSKLMSCRKQIFNPFQPLI